MKKKLTRKQVAKIIQERYDSESPNIYESEEERIATEKIIAERRKEIEEYGRKLYGEEYDRLRNQ